MKKNLIALAAITMLTALGLAGTTAQAETRKFVMNTVEVDGVKMWLPATLIVKKGDVVEITATSRLGKGTVHGFTIKDFKIVEAADETGKVIKFTADKAGIFPYFCQLHPAHVGGQLLVVE